MEGNLVTETPQYVTGVRDLPPLHQRKWHFGVNLHRNPTQWIHSSSSNISGACLPLIQ